MPSYGIDSNSNLCTRSHVSSSGKVESNDPLKGWPGTAGSTGCEFRIGKSRNCQAAETLFSFRGTTGCTWTWDPPLDVFHHKQLTGPLYVIFHFPSSCIGGVIIVH